MNEQVQSPTEIIASLEKRLAEMEAEKVSLVTENISLRQLYERAPFAYQFLDSTGCFIEVNQAWLATLGYTREEVIGRNFGDFLHPDRKDHFKDNFPRFKAIGEILGIEFEMVKKNGSTILVSFHDKISEDNEGHFKQAHCIFQDITERKNTENTLRLRESCLSAIINNQPGLLWLKDRHNKFLAVNTEFSKSCGLNNPEFLIGKTDLEIWPKELADKYIEDDAEVLKSGKPLVVEEVISDKGETKWFETFKAPVFDSQEIVIGTTGYSRDITERKKAEEALRESEKQYRSIVEQAAEGIVLVDTETYRFVDFNDTACSGLGYSREEFTNLSLIDVQSSLAKDDFVRCFNAVVESGGGVFENRQLRKDGTHRDTIISNRVINLKGRKYVSGIWQDITERKKAEQKLRHSYELMNYIIRHNTSALAVHDKDFKYLFVSERYLEDYKVKDRDVIGKHHYDVFPDLPQKWRDVHKKALNGITSRAENDRYDRADGSVEWTTWECRPWYEANGDVGGFVVYTEVVTDRIKAEEQKILLQQKLHQSQKMEAIGTLAGGIAHDFNNILGAILGYAEMARDDSPTESLVAKNLDKVLEAGHRAASLVKQILTFSRNADTECIPLNPACIVKEALGLLRPSLPSTIAIKQQIATATKTIHANPTQVHQILINLCTNAFHAMEQTGGTLEVTLKDCELSRNDLQQHPEVEPGSFVVLSISDTGTGIDPEIWGRIFDPYFTTKGVGKGTGMGLSIVHGIVTGYAGFITGESNHGNGTIFHVFFPATEEEVGHDANLAETALPGTERILLVDDEEILVEMGKAMLEQLGYAVTTRTSSLEALTTFQNQPNEFDVVITDQTMPSMTGVNLAQQMLKIRPGLPIILCTGYSNLVNDEQAKNYGIKGFAMKPFSKKKIAVLLRLVLNEKLPS